MNQAVTNKVLIDLTQLPLQRTGVGIYAINYVRCLQASTLGQELHFFVLDDDAELIRETHAVPNAVVTVLKASLFRRFVLRVVLEQVLIPAYALSRRIDAVHSLHYSFPMLSFGRFKRIVTVHDMLFYLFPRMHVPVKRVFFQYFIRKLTGVEGLLFVSQSTMNDFHRQFPGCSVPGKVILEGADFARLSAAPDPELVAQLRQRFDIDRYVLYIGTVEPRKNILGLVKAFETIASEHPDIKLVIAGKLGWDYDDVLRYIEASVLRSRIVMTGYISEAEKHALLKSALVFTYVSFYEGFGLPPLEGMAAGVPTITSNISSMPEVAGDAAVQVDPYDTRQIADAMHRLLSEPAERARLIESGLAQSRLFTWEGMTEKSLAFYASVLAPSAATN
jgi:glycosyltransferase involved in cell wall biosynthesis